MVWEACDINPHNDSNNCGNVDAPSSRSKNDGRDSSPCWDELYNDVDDVWRCIIFAVRFILFVDAVMPQSWELLVDIDGGNLFLLKHLILGDGILIWGLLNNVNVEGGRTSPSTTQTLLCNEENEKSIVNMIVTAADEELFVVALIIIIVPTL